MSKPTGNNKVVAKTAPTTAATKPAARAAATKPAATTAATKPAATTAATTAAAKANTAASTAAATETPVVRLDNIVSPKAEATPSHSVPKPNTIAETPQAAAASGPGAEAPVEKKTRQQLTNVLNINISQARCATHLKQNLGDEEIEDQIKELRKALKAAKDTKNAAKEAELKASIADLSKVLCRISSDTPIAAAVTMDCMVKEMIRHGMDHAIAGDRKIVEVSHLHDGTPEGMLHYPLFCKLPSFVEYNPDHEEELRKERAMANKAAKEAREAKKAALEEKKAAAKGGPKQSPKGAPKAAAVLEEEDDGEDDHAEHTKTTFFTYVENALKTVKKDEPYRTMRVSNRVREYLSDLVAEGIARLANLARIVVQQVMGVRTMNADHIKAIVHLLMADGGRSIEQIDEVKSQIDVKLDIYHTHLKTEKEKKAASLDSVRKADLEKKRLEAEFLRKNKQIENAKKRAAEASQKAETLTAEANKLEPIVAANQAAAALKKAEAGEAASAALDDGLEVLSAAEAPVIATVTATNGQ
jgi:hypothetical protein